MIGPTDLLHPPPAPHFETFQVLQANNTINTINWTRNVCTSWPLGGYVLWHPWCACFLWLKWTTIRREL